MESRSPPTSDRVIEMAARMRPDVVVAELGLEGLRDGTWSDVLNGCGATSSGDRGVDRLPRSRPGGAGAGRGRGRLPRSRRTSPDELLAAIRTRPRVGSFSASRARRRCSARSSAPRAGPCRRARGADPRDGQRRSPRAHGQGRVPGEHLARAADPRDRGQGHRLRAAQPRVREDERAEFLVQLQASLDKLLGSSTRSSRSPSWSAARSS